MAFTRIPPGALNRTPADFARNFLAATAAFKSAVGRPPVIVPGPYLPKAATGPVMGLGAAPPAIRRARVRSFPRGLGANPNAGTYDDPNCPSECWWVGNALDTSLFGQTCWPCHNICPTGSQWDTTNLQCSTAPASVNPNATPAGPDTTGAGCPGYCNWLPLASTFFSECQPCAGNAAPTSGLSTAALIGVGLVGVLAFGYVFGGRR